MYPRIAMEMTTLDKQYRGKINQLYSETQSKLDSMDELLRKRLTTASTTTTTINTIFNRFNDEGNDDRYPPSSESKSEVGTFNAAAESILVRPFLDNDDADIVANKKKYGVKKYDPQRVLNAWRQGSDSIDILDFGGDFLSHFYGHLLRECFCGHIFGQFLKSIELPPRTGTCSRTGRPG